MANYSSDIHVRLNGDQLREFERIAENMELTKSELLRFLLQLPVEDMAKADVHAVCLDAMSLADIYTELKRWGHNLNQATRVLNGIGVYLEDGGFVDEQWVGSKLESATAAVDKTRVGLANAEEAFGELAKLPQIKTGRKRPRPR